MAELLDEAAVAAALGELPNWTGDTGGLSRTAELPGFLTAIAVVNRVAAIAEAMNHHPDVDIRYRTLTFRCATHSAGGATDLDVTLAARIESELDRAD